jgi:hypothetical protein
MRMLYRNLSVGLSVFTAACIVLTAAWTPAREGAEPTITCPGNEIHSANVDGFQTENFTATNEADEVDSVTAVFTGSGVQDVQVFYTVSPPATPVEGYVTYDVTDHCASGGVIDMTAWNDGVALVTCPFNISLINAAPSITCPPHVSDPYNAPVVSDDFSTSDDNGDPVSVSISGTVPGSVGGFSIVGNHVEFVADSADVGIVYTVTLLVTEDAPCNLSNTCDFTMTATNDPPEFTTCPDAELRGCDDTGYESTEFAVHDANDSITSVTVSFSGSGVTAEEVIGLSGLGTQDVTGKVRYEVSDHCQGPGTFTLTAYDQAGDQGTCDFDITLENQVPTITCPGNVTGSYNETLVSGAFTAEDECPDVTPTVEVTDVTPAAPTNLPVVVGDHVEWNPTVSDIGVTYTVTLTVTDDCGATATCTFTMTAPSDPPEFTTCPDAESRGCDSTDYESTSFAVHDANDSITSVTVSFSGSGVSNQEVVDLVGIGTPDVTGKVRYDVSDHCAAGGTFTLMAKDQANSQGTCDFGITLTNDAPTIACPGNVTGSYNETLVSGDFSAEDECWDVTPTIGITSVFPSVPTNPPTVVGNHVEWIPTVTDIGVTYTVTLRVTDDCNAMATCSFTMTARNDDPTITCPGDVIRNENGSYTANGVIADDPDGDISSLFVSFLGSGVSNVALDNVQGLGSGHATGEVDYDVIDHCLAGGTVTVTVTDGGGKTKNCAFDIDLSNTSPDITCPVSASFAYNQVYNGTATATDADGDSYEFSKVGTTPVGLDVASDGGITWDTDCDDVGGPYDVSVRVTDECGDSDECTFQLTVTNDPPEITCPAESSVHGGNPFVSDDFSTSDTEGEIKAVSILGISPTPPSGNQPEIVNSHVEWVTERGDEGGPQGDFAKEVYSIKVEVTDSCGLIDTCRFPVTVYNRAPIADARPDNKVMDVEDTAIFDGYHSWDQDGDEISSYHWRVVKTVPEGLTYTLLDTHKVEVTFIPHNPGTYELQLAVGDSMLEGHGDPAWAVVSIVDHPPEWDPIPDTSVNEGQTLVFRVHATDPDGDAITLQVVGGLPQNATFVDSGNGAGSLTFTPDYYQAGDYDVIFRATALGSSCQDTSSITVFNINQAPEVEGIPDLAIWKGGPVFPELLLDSYVQDDDHDSTMTWSFSQGNKISVDTSLRVATLRVDDLNWHGFETITFTATDPGALSDSDDMIASVCAFAPETLSFSGTRVGDTSAAEDLTVYNTMNRPMQLDPPQNADDFTVFTYPWSIPAQSSGTVGIRFHPSQRGSTTQAVGIPAESLDTAWVFCAGLGVRESLVIDPDYLAFDTVNVGSISDPKTVEVTNEGDGVYITSITSNNDDFSIESDECSGVTLLTGHTCSFDAKYNPSSQGLGQGWITLRYDAIYDTQCVQLVGYGGVPILEVYPNQEDTMDFDTVEFAQRSAPESVWVANTGDGNLEVDSFQVIGQKTWFDLADTIVVKDTLIRPQEAIPFAVYFYPPSTGAIQERHCQLIVYSMDSSDTVNMKGTPKRGGIVIYLEPDDNYDFGPVLVDELAIKESCYVRNENLDSVMVDSLMPSDGTYFELVLLESLPKTLCPGPDPSPTTSLYFNCIFKPDGTVMEQTLSTDILVYGKKSDTPWGSDSLLKSRYIKGTGVAPLIRLSPDTISFPPAHVCSTTVRSTVTIENKGSWPLEIRRVCATGDSAIFPVSDITTPHFLNRKGDKKSFSVAFHPPDTLQHSERLCVVSNAYNDDSLVYLFGKGYVVDDSCPRITDFTPDTASSGKEARILAHVTDNLSGVDSVELRYRLGDDNEFDRLMMARAASDTFKATIPSGSVTLSGLEYDIRAVDSAGNECNTGIFPLRVRFHNVSQHSSLWYHSLNSIDDRWILFSIPGELDQNSLDPILTNDLGPPGDESWKVVGYDDGAYQYYQTSGATPFGPGKGFWFKCINSDNDFRVRAGSGTTCSTSVAFKTELDAGWNLIANPFFFNLDVYELICRNDKLKGPFWYDKGGAHASADGWVYPDAVTVSDDSDSSLYLEPWKGYAVRNDYGHKYTLSLDPHVLAAEKSAGTRVPLVDLAWTIVLSLSAEAGDVVDEVRLGSSEDCCELEDIVDFPKPPHVEPTVSVYFPNPGCGQSCGDYATDYRGLIDRGAVWDFAVDNHTDRKELQLSWQGLASVPSEFEAVLYDRMKNVTIDMRKQEGYGFSHYENRDYDRFRLFVGRPGYVEEEISSVQAGIPREFKLRQNYPNPFNAGTAISFDLPQGCPVRVKIYNILGRSVVTLYDQPTYPGKHTVFWDGKDGEGNEVGSGIYFCRLSAPGLTRNMKMLLLK